MQGAWPSMHGTALFASVARMNHSCCSSASDPLPSHSPTIEVGHVRIMSAKKNEFVNLEKRNCLCLTIGFSSFGRFASSILCPVDVLLQGAPNVKVTFPKNSSQLLATSASGQKRAETPVA